MTKDRRVVDRGLLATVRGLTCLACGPGRQREPTEPDHVTTRGAGGGDLYNNVWPLCAEHHRERHRRGLGHMIKTYGACRHWIELAERTDILARVERLHVAAPGDRCNGGNHEAEET